MYRGRFQQGQEITIGCPVVNGSGAPTLPDAAPTVRVYDASLTLVFSGTVPIIDRFGTTALFAYQQFLDQRFPAGTYVAVYQWAISSTGGASVDYFEVVGGGSQRGAVVGMAFYRRPHADFVVKNTFEGAITEGRNPSI